MLDLLEGVMDRAYGRKKTQVFQDLPSRVVEIGPGPGANLRYYRAGTHLIAVEPNRDMHLPLTRNAARYGIDVEILPVPGEDLDLDDNSVEAVVGTLVLCTVQEPVRVVEQIHRILSPGGRYIFLEHVASEPGSLLRRWQDLLQRPWHWLFEGCHLNRETPRVILESGFSRVDMDCFLLRPQIALIAPHIFGQAVK